MNLFYDVYFSPLNVYSLSLIINKLINKPIYGLYHCASSDSISKYDFGMKMAEIFQLDSLNINKASVDSMKFSAPRPKQMTLNIDKISNDLEYVFPSVVDAIKLLKHQLI
jgi:dTDP-4-dehydrorhamnose reductase